MKKTDYDADHAGRYDAGRALTPEMEASWLAAAQKYLPSGRKLRIIDIGSGTGRFSELFASKLQATITGVEPADEMRKIAERKRSTDSIKYLKGAAENLPITDERFDLAWLSMIIHHVKDRKACGVETARVLERDGVAIVRNSYRGRLEGIELYKYFPGALEVDNGRLPSVEEVRGAFERAGFKFIALESVEQVFAESFQVYIEKLRKRGISTLRLISDGDFNQGLARMEEILKTGDKTGPVTEVIDMLVFKKI